MILERADFESQSNNFPTPIVSQFLNWFNANNFDIKFEFESYLKLKFIRKNPYFGAGTFAFTET